MYNDAAMEILFEKNGREPKINVLDKKPKFACYFKVFKHLLHGSFEPKSKQTIETINDRQARRSEYLTIVETCFDVIKDYKSIYLQRTL